MKNYHFSAEITKDPEINQYIDVVPGLPGAHSQAPTLDQLYKNLQKVILLCLDKMTDEEKKNLPEFIGIHQISVKA